METILNAFPWNDFAEAYNSLLDVLQIAKGLEIRAGSKKKMCSK